MPALQGQGAAGKQNQMWAALSSLPGPRAPRVPVGRSDVPCLIPQPQLHHGCQDESVLRGWPLLQSCDKLPPCTANYSIDLECT